jgi:carbon-monoxide dehydrogenase large subunit
VDDPAPRYVGRALHRPHDDALVAGGGRFVGDVRVPGLLEAHFVRSDLAHAHVARVDVSAARGVPGVIAAYAAADLDLPDVPQAPRSAAPQAMRRPALARDRVRFAGEAVAVVLAENRYAAEDGAAEVVVDLDPRPAVVGISSALGDAPALFDGLPNVAGAREYGAGVEDVFTAAPVVVRTVADSPRLAPTSIEPRAILAVPPTTGPCTSGAPTRPRTACGPG